MPQMAPLNWTLLLLTFSLALIIFSTMNYYSFSYNIKFKKSYPTKKTINWKW